MDPFSPSESSSVSSSGRSGEAVMGQTKAQLAQAYSNEFLETVRSKCFSKCTTKPGTSLDGSEISCVYRCIEHNVEATGTVGQSLYSQRTVALQNMWFLVSLTTSRRQSEQKTRAAIFPHF